VTFTLHVDAELWRGSLKSVHDELQAMFEPQTDESVLVPVIAADRYGLSPARLAIESRNLGVTTISVDSVFEVADVAEYFPGEILVQQPWDPRDAVAQRAWDELEQPLIPRIIRTVASTEALHRLASETNLAVPVVIAGLTSACGAGVAEPELHAVLADDVIRTALVEGRIEIRGLHLDLPQSQPRTPTVSTTGMKTSGGLPDSSTNRVREAWGWAVIWVRALAAAEQSHIPLSTSATTVWLAGITDDELRDFKRALEMLPTRVLATDSFWWSAPDALVAYGTVLAVHRVMRGREVGQHQRRAPKDGYLVVVSGGTRNGIGLHVAAGTRVLDRAGAAAASARAALGRTASPFSWAGRERRYLEAPTETTSLLWLSEADVQEALAAGHRTPGVGDQWPCRPGPTGYRYDRVIGLD